MVTIMNGTCSYHLDSSVAGDLICKHHKISSYVASVINFDIFVGN